GEDSSANEISCEKEIKSREEHEVPLPDGNETFNSLAKKLAQDLPRAQKGDPEAAGKRMRQIVRAADDPPKEGSGDADKAGAAPAGGGPGGRAEAVAAERAGGGLPAEDGEGRRDEGRGRDRDVLEVQARRRLDGAGRRADAARREGHDGPAARRRAQGGGGGAG